MGSSQLGQRLVFASLDAVPDLLVVQPQGQAVVLDAAFIHHYVRTALVCKLLIGLPKPMEKDDLLHLKALVGVVGDLDMAVNGWTRLGEVQNGGVVVPAAVHGGTRCGIGGRDLGAMGEGAVACEGTFTGVVDDRAYLLSCGICRDRSLGGGGSLCGGCALRLLLRGRLRLWGARLLRGLPGLTCLGALRHRQKCRFRVLQDGRCRNRWCGGCKGAVNGERRCGTKKYNGDSQCGTKKSCGYLFVGSKVGDSAVIAMVE